VFWFCVVLFVAAFACTHSQLSSLSGSFMSVHAMVEVGTFEEVAQAEKGTYALGLVRRMASWSGTRSLWILRRGRRLGRAIV
jgi:hypothetical protein